MIKKIFLLVFCLFLIGCSEEMEDTIEVQDDVQPEVQDDAVVEDVQDDIVEEREIETKDKFVEKQQCVDEDIIFAYPPVNLDKTAVMVPFGLMTGSHVTPIDHQYFQDFSNDEPDIEVYSPGDGKVTSIQHMTGSYFEGQKEIAYADFRLEIQHTCTLSSTYIHIDVLSDKIAKVAPPKGDYSSVNVPVEAGELIGYYQTNVDYNLVDQDVVLEGFVNPDTYAGEPWKIHVPDTLLYFTEDIRNKMIEKSLRSVEPFGGKFDHDIDGTLIGNWFKENTKGYRGVDKERYWSGHLSISPDYIDPEHIIVSMGDFEGREEQLGVKGNAPNPAEVDVNTGLVKYELVSFDYVKKDGRSWDRKTVYKGLKRVQLRW